MSILAPMQSAAVKLMGQRPSAFFGSTGNFEIELADMVNEVAQDIVSYQDWQALTRIATITGDGVAEDYALPDDYGSMLVNAEVDDLTNWFWGYQAFTDLSTFLRRKASGFEPWPGGWIIYQDRIHFAPLIPASQAATFPYMTKNFAVGINGTPKAEFTADTDIFLLPERLLMLGLVWRWRDNKGLEATGDEAAFIKALDEYGSKDSGTKIFRSRRRPYANVSAALPWSLGPGTY